MKNSYDVKDNLRCTDNVLNLLNYLNELKSKNNVSLGTVFADVIENTTKLFSNMIKNDKVDSGTVESYMTFLLNEMDGYFCHKHEGLKKAVNCATVDLEMAVLVKEDRYGVEKRIKLGQ